MPYVGERSGGEALVFLPRCFFLCGIGLYRFGRASISALRCSCQAKLDADELFDEDSELELGAGAPSNGFMLKKDIA